MPVVPGPDTPSITESDLTRLRAMVSDPAGSDQQFSDDDYAYMLQQRGEINATAAYFWGIKASEFADLVDTSESGSSRSNSQLYKNALEMQKFYTSQTPTEVVHSTRRTVLRRIKREKIDTL